MVAPARFTLFQEGIDAFAGILGVEQVDEALTFGTQPAVWRALAGTLQQGLDGPYRDRALPRHAGGQQQGMTTRLAVIDQLLDQTDLQGGLCIDTLTAEDHALGPAFADQPGQVLRAAGTGQQANSGLG